MNTRISQLPSRRASLVPRASQLPSRRASLVPRASQLPSRRASLELRISGLARLSVPPRRRGMTQPPLGSNPNPWTASWAPSVAVRTHKHRRNFWRSALGCVALALASAVSVPGCVQAEMSVPDLEVTRQDVSIQPAPSTIPAGTEVTVVQQFKYEKTPSPLPSSITSSMHATDVTFTLKRGATDLAFIHGATLTVAGPGGKPETVLEYEPKAGGTKVNAITLPLLSSPDALNPWSVDTSTFELTITGILPTEVWFMDVTISYSGSVTYSS